TAHELAADVRAGDREAAILDAVFRAILVGLVEISSVPLRPGPGGRAKVRKPKVGRLARLDAEKGSGWTTGPAHNVVRLDVVSLNLLPLMDGTRDREALKGALLTAVRDGRIRLK